MSRPYDKPIMIQKISEATEDWTDLFDKPLHAKVNKASADNKYLNAGATRATRSLVFEIRYFAGIEVVSHNPQKYRIVYQNVPYAIEDYDDYMLEHKTVKLLGVSY